MIKRKSSKAIKSRIPLKKAGKRGAVRTIASKGKKRVRRTALKKPVKPTGSYNQSYDAGFDAAYNEGFNVGYAEGMEAGHQDAYKGD